MPSKNIVLIFNAIYSKHVYLVIWTSGILILNIKVNEFCKGKL